MDAPPVRVCLIALRLHPLLSSSLSSRLLPHPAANRASSLFSSHLILLGHKGLSKAFWGSYCSGPVTRRNRLPAPFRQWLNDLFPRSTNATARRARRRRCRAETTGESRAG